MTTPKKSQATVPRANTLLNQAFVHHQGGRLNEARAIYESVVNLHPQNFDALHMLGVVAAQLRDHRLAIDYFAKAVAVDPNNVSCHSNHVISLNALNQLDAALASLERALDITPGAADLWLRKGVLLYRLNRFDAALTSFDQTISLKPADAHAYFNRGNALRKLTQAGAAIDSYDKAISLKPDYAGAHFNRGNTLRELKQFEAAVDSYERAISAKPDHADAYCNRGVALMALNQLDAAISSFSHAIELKADHADAYCNRGTAMNKLKQFDAAIASYDEAIRHQPDRADVYSNRGMTLCELSQLDAAVASCDMAIRLQPEFAEAYSNRGNALRGLNQLEAAIASYDRAISLKPDYAEAFYNRGIVLGERHQHAMAIADYERAIAFRSDYAEAYWNKGLAMLVSGDFENGWPLYEWRWEKEKERVTKPVFTQPGWTGAESLVGKTILLYSEQGMGDAIQFIRYAKLVAARGGKVIASVPRELLSLLRGIGGVSQWFANGDALPGFDFHCPLLSLPLAFKTSVATIPSPAAYLQAAPDKLAIWTDKLGPKQKRRVGLVWRGRAEHQNDRNRSIGLAQMIEHLPAGFEVVSLQKEIADIDRATLATCKSLRYFGDEISDFADTAALCKLMDVVISVDTSVAHLSGALGKTTWVLLPYVPDWRWMLDRTDSPWYPSMTLYRQDRDKRWDVVLKQVSADLLAMGR